MQTISSNSMRWAITLLLVAGYAQAHEGHAPLPTKGVQVDVPKGLITLSPAAHKSLGLQTAAIEQQALEETALAYATLVTPWKQQFFISSQLPGKIAALHVVTGESVEPGQLLAEISSPELETLQLELRTASNELKLSTQQAERLRGLVEAQAVPGRDYLEATAKYEQDKNALRIAQSKLLSLGISQAAIDDSLNRNNGATSLFIPLKSPLGGTVSHADLSIGKIVAANEHLFEVNDLSKLWVKIGILERDVARVKKGQRVVLDFSAFPNQPVEAAITVPVMEVDPVTHVVTAWAEIENSGTTPKYLPGMYGTAKVVTSEPTKLLSVPASALLGTGAERYLLVEVAATAKGYEYRRQNVEVVAQNAVSAQLRAGALFPGDRVVKTGGQILSSFFILGSLRLSDEGLRNVDLQVQPVAEQVVENVLAIDGIIDLPPGRVAAVSSQLAGTLTQIHVDRGQQVQAGQVLAEVSGLPLMDTQLAMLKANLEAKLLEATLARLKSSDGSGVVAARKIMESESARDAAVNRRESARQTLLTMGLTAGEIDEVFKSGQTRTTLPIRAPINGMVVRFDKVLGQGVVSNEPLFEIHDTSHPWAKGYLSESLAPQVKIGSSARVRLLADPSFVATGKVVRSARMLNAENRTLAVWIEFDELPKAALPTQPADTHYGHHR